MKIITSGKIEGLSLEPLGVKAWSLGEEFGEPLKNSCPSRVFARVLFFTEIVK
jgi:hypothetical protein